MKTGRDVDYFDYYVGFGKGKDRVWLSGIFGPTATSGAVPKYMLDESVTSKRRWSFGEAGGVDSKGRLANGNYWRYFGTFGEAIKYFDVPKEAADYFDTILDSVCYQPWKN